MSLYQKVLESQLSKEQLEEVDAIISLLTMLGDEDKLKDVNYQWFKTLGDPPVRVKVFNDTKEVIVFARASLYTIQYGDTVVNNRTLLQVKEFLYETF